MTPPTPTPEVPLPEPVPTAFVRGKVAAIGAPGAWTAEVIGDGAEPILHQPLFSSLGVQEYAEAHAARAVELERARVVALVFEHDAVAGYDGTLACGGCDWTETGNCNHSDHLVALITRADDEESPDA